MVALVFPCCFISLVSELPIEAAVVHTHFPALQVHLHQSLSGKVLGFAHSGMTIT